MQIDPLYQVNEFRKIRGVTALHIAAELNVSKSTYYRRLRLGGGGFRGSVVRLPSRGEKGFCNTVND